MNEKVSLFTMAIVAMLISGCADHGEIDSVYGQRRGRHVSSVNGTSVLAGMFEDAGFKVYSWRRLSPKLDSYQAIIWFPDDFQPPTEPQRQFLEQWLADSPGRTLVYVGRDYDATADYWQSVSAQAPLAQQEVIMRRVAEARAVHAARRLDMPAKKSFEWFSLRREVSGWSQNRLTDGAETASEQLASGPTVPPPEDGPEGIQDVPLPQGGPQGVQDIPVPQGIVSTAACLAGEWGRGIQGEETRIHIEGRLEIPSQEDFAEYVDDLGEDAPLEEPLFEPLLESGKVVLVSQVTKPSWSGASSSGSKILVVINGSFLLNLPLVNHQHRQLAGTLIRACGDPGKAAFLESHAGGPDVLTQESASSPQSSENHRDRVFVAVHWFVLGLLYCLCVLPIFGRPKRGKQETVADFGQHLRSLGALLQKVGDREYARKMISQYHNVAKRDSGARHVETDKNNLLEP